MHIVIIGAGRIGKAMASLVQNKKKVFIDFWDKDVAKVIDQKPLLDIVTDADIVFMCVPSSAVRVVSEAIQSHLSSKTGVISLSKGIEQETYKTMAEVLQEVLPPGQEFALLDGPMLADEIVQGLPTVGALGTTTRRLYTRLKKLFENTNLRVEYNHDVQGVALASVLKNIYAIGTGIGEGLGYGDNFRGWFLSQASQEMAIILKMLKSKPTTAYSAAGLGDLIATGISPYSRNHTVGREIGSQGQTALKSEGLHSLVSILYLINNQVGELPILSALQKVLLEKQSARTIFEALLAN